MNYDNYPSGMYYLPDDDWDEDDLDPEIKAELEALKEQPEED
jgi:hypothetical protein